MSSGNAAYIYDSLGRLISVEFPNGAMATYDYDEMGNRTTVVEIPAGLPPDYSPPTVTSFAKRQSGDFSNPAMIVLLSTGELVGWGDTTTGVLANGNNSGAQYFAPPQSVLFNPNSTMPPASAYIVDYAFSNANLYVVFSCGWVYSAGSNSYGQLGMGDVVARAQLTRVEYFVDNNISITKVWGFGSAYNTGTGGCAYFLDSKENIYGCGSNAAGNLANAATPTTDLHSPAACTGVSTTKQLVDLQSVCCGTAAFSTYLLYSDGTLLVAGFNSTGQLGVNTYTNVTGGFVSAQLSSGSNVSNFASIAANGGANASTAVGNALAIDTSGNVWAVGSNANGELGLGDQNDRASFTQISALSNIIQAAVGGGCIGYSYAMNTSGMLYTWGYNGVNNLFHNTTTTPITAPAIAASVPGTISQVFFTKGEQTDALSQLIVITSVGIFYAGVANGQEGIAGTMNPGAYSGLPMPDQFTDGSLTISDLFVHGGGANQRWFILASDGSLWSSGENYGAVCTGSLTSNVMPSNVAWYRFSFV